MNVFELENIINEKLNANRIKDYAPNGLQIEGKHEIKKIITGVTASQRLIDEAIAKNADLLLVHHGYFWRGEDMRIIHMKHRRIASLIKHDINLMGYHLPLDMEPEFGNNARLAQLFDIQDVEGLDPFEAVKALMTETKTTAPIQILELETKEICHDGVVDVASISEPLIAFLQEDIR